MTETNARSLPQQAARYRKLAREITDDVVRRALVELAEEYEARAVESEASAQPEQVRYDV